MTKILNTYLVNSEWFDSVLCMPGLEDVLEEVGPLPKDTVFFGQAEDALPVLLNLQDAAPGSILITGDSGAGKTYLLQVIAQFVISTYSPRQIQFVVVTNRTSEWKDFADFPQCVGIFSPQRNGVDHLLQSLAIWMDTNGNKDQSVLLLVDGIEEALCCDALAQAHLRKILSDDPVKHVWPILTSDPKRCERTKPWLNLFRTRIYGYSQLNGNDIGQLLGVPHIESGALSKGYFSLKEGSRWLKFWVPALDN